MKLVERNFAVALMLKQSCPRGFDPRYRQIRRIARAPVAFQHKRIADWS